MISKRSQLYIPFRRGNGKQMTNLNFILSDEINGNLFYWKKQMAHGVGIPWYRSKLAEIIRVIRVSRVALGLHHWSGGTITLQPLTSVIPSHRSGLTTRSSVHCRPPLRWEPYRVFLSALFAVLPIGMLDTERMGVRNVAAVLEKYTPVKFLDSRS